MQGKQKQGRCRCGSKAFEEVDATPAGTEKERHFTRCKQCGLVISTYRCGNVSKPATGWARLAGKLASGI
ncbi:hypothetical protein [Anaeroselena agilis]|uniref:Transposase n=1 Tax=Anaeroselena agilis TaxID=3063788 RepID=A0ABU3P022_9FIRM|nr:hypothetical protein [Selenomonadales bacterium 4137-cl]